MKKLPNYTKLQWVKFYLRQTKRDKRVLDGFVQEMKVNRISKNIMWRNARDEMMKYIAYLHKKEVVAMLAEREGLSNQEESEI